MLSSSKFHQLPWRADKQLIAQDSHAKSQTKRQALPEPIRGAQTGWVGRGRESNWMSRSVSKWVDFLDSPRSTRTRPIHTFVNTMFTISLLIFTDGALFGGVGRIILGWYIPLKWNQYKRSTAKCSWYSCFDDGFLLSRYIIPQEQAQDREERDVDDERDKDVACPPVTNREVNFGKNSLQ